ncbi:hypothetical protein [Azospirillum endophyticum]
MLFKFPEFSEKATKGLIATVVMIFAFNLPNGRLCKGLLLP